MTKPTKKAKPVQANAIVWDYLCHADQYTICTLKFLDTNQVRYVQINTIQHPAAAFIVKNQYLYVDADLEESGEVSELITEVTI